MATQPISMNIIKQVLNHRFNRGNPAYCDDRMEDFKTRLPYFEQELKRKHVTSKLLWEEYRKDKPDGYGLSQFRYDVSVDELAYNSAHLVQIHRYHPQWITVSN